MSTKQPLKVHITGVYGLIGNLMYRHMSSQPELYDVYGSGRRAVSSARADREAILQLPVDHFFDRRFERRASCPESHRRDGRGASYRRCA